MPDPPSSAFPTHTWQPAAADFPVLLGHYRIVGILGEGGMGTVFKGYHLKLKRFVAIKTLRLDRVRRPDLVQRFLREMGAVGQMDHPNVVRAFDAGERNGVLYLVMEHLSGIDLERLLAERGRLDPAEACALARQAALGLAYVHQAFVHRDIKPSNLMLTTAGRVKILDLGLVRLDDPMFGGPGDWDQTPEGHAIGTYDYIAPEQALGTREIDGRADIYSLGCTLFKMLIGRAPYHSPVYDGLAKKLFAHCHTPLDAVPGFQSVPEPVATVLMRMTAKDPEQRYPSAQAAADALAPLAAPVRALSRLAGGSTTSDAAVRPLPAQLPDEISRLTEVPLDTPVLTPGSTSAVASIVRSVTSRRGRLVLLALVFAAGVGVPAAMIVPRWRNQPAEQPDGLLTLRSLEARRAHKLLDVQPVTLSSGDGDDLQGIWDNKLLTLAVNADNRNMVLFPLGKTERTHFTLDVGIKQSTWTGGVGVFWGYQEDAKLKAAREPGVVFAKFQALLLWRIPVEPLDARFLVRRTWVKLDHDQNGKIREGIATAGEDEVPFPESGLEKMLHVEVAGERLKSAVFNNTPLTGVCKDDATNEVFKSMPATGALGLTSKSASAVFSNVWFTANR
jgi:serine/threonine protein kinase